MNTYCKPAQDKQVKNRMNQLQRAEITVRGDVQAVGYRYAVRKTATKLSIQGYAQNMPDGTVKIIAEAPKNAIQKFIETIRVKEPPITVEHIEAKYTKPTGEFKFFAIKYGELAEEMAEGFGTGQSYINLSRTENKQGFRMFKEETRGGFKDLKKEFAVSRAETKQGFKGLRTEMKGMREDMNKNFSTMSTKYDVISRNLSGAVKAIQKESVQTRAELIRAVDNLSKLVQAFIEDTRKRRQSRN